MLGRYSTMKDTIPGAQSRRPLPRYYGVQSLSGLGQDDDAEKMISGLTKTLAISLAVGIALKVAMKMVAARI